MEKEQLEQYISRIEKLNEDVDNLKSDIRQVYAEARGNGFSAKGIREVIKLRKLNPADRMEEEFLRTQYLEMMGMKGE